MGAGVVAKSKFPLTTPTTRHLLMSDPLRNPAGYPQFNQTLAKIVNG
jgi:hypothetical protein